MCTLCGHNVRPWPLMNVLVAQEAGHTPEDHEPQPQVGNAKQEPRDGGVLSLFPHVQPPEGLLQKECQELDGEEVGAGHHGQERAGAKVRR